MSLSHSLSSNSTDGIGSRRRKNSRDRPEPVEGPPFALTEEKQSLDKRWTNGERGPMHRPLRLTIDRTAIQENWRWLQDRAGVPAGAAIKADGYGLGAREAAQALHHAGCRDFFVSTWAEAEELG